MIAALVNTAVYAPCFLGLYGFVTGEMVFPRPLIAWHITGMVLNFIAMFLTFCDLYRRWFRGPNDKLIWSLLIRTCRVSVPGRSDPLATPCSGTCP